MYCRGGEHCCHRDHLNQCDVGEGDCNEDEECKGSLICGSNNCLDNRSPADFYDEEDDCCERRCTPSHPCGAGEGHCESDSDCKSASLACGLGNCLDQDTFPFDQFPMNYRAYSFTSEDNCCYTLCSPQDKCDTKILGCSTDEDCKDGLYCDLETNSCQDIDECDPENGKVDGLIKCGHNTDCVNSDKSYSCNCKTGFHNYVEYEGCVDIDECTEGSHNCISSRIQCMNTVGSFVCVCKEGYTGSGKDCNDVDECKIGSHNCNTYDTVSAETSYIDGGVKTFDIGPYLIDDGKSHKFRFDLQSYGTSILGIGNIEEEILFYVEENTVKIEHMKNGVSSELLGSTDLPKEAKPGENFVTYHFYLKISGGNIDIIFGANGKDVVENIQHSEYPINITTFSFQSKTSIAFWRNARKDGPDPMEYCTNFFGTFACSPFENYAISFGGHAETKWDFPYEVSVVTRQLYSCPNHLIPNKEQYVLGNGMAVLDDILYSCGGFYYGMSYSPETKCGMINLNQIDSGWTSAPPLPHKVAHIQMVTYENSIFFWGGVDPAWSMSHSGHYELNHQTNSWTPMKNHIVESHGSTAIADEEDGRIWSLCGHTYGKGNRNDVYYYKVGTDSWHFHSNMTYAAEYNGCAIIYDRQMKKLILCVVSYQIKSIYSFNLAENTGWKYIGSLKNNQIQSVGRMIAFDKFNAALLSGYSARYKYSVKNFLQFFPDKNRFYYGRRYLTNPGYASYWTPVSTDKNLKAVSNCLATKFYAAVGYGGTSLDTRWSVVLRQRTIGDTGTLETCHNKIPPLEPSRTTPGVTSVGYRLMVCGGQKEAESTPTDECFYLDTNLHNHSYAEWSPMDSMPNARNGFSFVSYGDIAYAIGGKAEDKLIEVDRWTLSNGWEGVSPLPFSLYKSCGVADEGSGKIYVTGGKTDGYMNRNVLTYDVYDDTWKSTWVGTMQDYCGISIVHRKRDNHKMLMVIGKMIVYYYDLTDEKVKGYTRWSSLTPKHSSTGTRVISLSPTESIEVKI